jgi:hypothetical protein
MHNFNILVAPVLPFDTILTDSAIQRFLWDCKERNIFLKQRAVRLIHKVTPCCLGSSWAPEVNFATASKQSRHKHQRSEAMGPGDEVLCSPLHDLDSLWNWCPPGGSSESLEDLTRANVPLHATILPARPRLLFCHDYAGTLDSSAQVHGAISASAAAN